MSCGPFERLWPNGGAQCSAGLSRSGAHPAATIWRITAKEKLRAQVEDLTEQEAEATLQLDLVAEWAALHRVELSANWERARREEALETIEPLP